MTLYVGIDQSYRSSGLVFLNKDGSIYLHDIVSTTTADGDYFARAKLISEDIASRVYSVGCGGKHRHSLTVPDLKIGLEGLAFGMRGHTLQNLAGLQFLIVTALRGQGFDVTIHTPSKVKKFATGSGRAKKPEMFDALPDDVKALFGKVTKAAGREDLTDAYYIAQLMRT